MDKHYLSDQARGLAMAARSVDEKNLITQAANELIKCTDRRSYRVLSKLYRKNDTPETLYKRITRTNLTNYRNVGEVTKGNIYKLFEDLGVANG